MDQREGKTNRFLYACPYRSYAHIHRHTHTQIYTIEIIVVMPSFEHLLCAKHFVHVVSKSL